MTQNPKISLKALKKTFKKTFKRPLLGPRAPRIEVGGALPLLAPPSPGDDASGAIVGAGLGNSKLETSQGYTLEPENLGGTRGGQ